LVSDAKSFESFAAFTAALVCEHLERIIESHASWFVLMAGVSRPTTASAARPQRGRFTCHEKYIYIAMAKTEHRIVPRPRKRHNGFRRRGRNATHRVVMK
jgi:hypothetical protein